MSGYYDGFNSCGDGGGGFSEPEPEREFDPGFSRGFQESSKRYYKGWNWRQICSDVENFLSESFDDLVTSDGNALTLEGKMAFERMACGGQAEALLSNNVLALLEG